MAAAERRKRFGTLYVKDTHTHTRARARLRRVWQVGFRERKEGQTFRTCCLKTREIGATFLAAGSSLNDVVAVGFFPRRLPTLLLLFFLRFLTTEDRCVESAKT